MNRITCKDCIYFDYSDSNVAEYNRHPYKASWSHLCCAKYVNKFASDTACKTYFIHKKEMKENN